MASTINSNEQYTILGSTLQSICDSVSKATGAENIPVPMIPKMIDGINLKYEDIKDVMFMDYNGDLLYSWDKDDFINNVTELPAGPTWHETLTFQEWNWDLADIKDELENGSGACCIGACYTTKDGASHFYIDIDDEKDLNVTMQITRQSSGTVVVDWGDENTDSTSSNALLTHTYSTLGQYDVKVTGKFTITQGNYFFRRDPGSANRVGTWYATANNFLRRVELGVDAQIYAQHNYTLFPYCPNLLSVSVHNNLCVSTTITNALFQGIFRADSCLRFFVFPKQLGDFASTSIAYTFDVAFMGTTSMVSMSFPKGVKIFPKCQGMFKSSGIRFLYIPYMSSLTQTNASYYPCFMDMPNLCRFAWKVDSMSLAYTNGFYQAFSYCYSLRQISLDKINFSYPNRLMFYICVNLSGTVILPATCTQLTGDNFNSCYNVEKYVFLGDMTNIGVAAGNVFANNYSCLCWDFTHCTSVPSLYNTNCFTGIKTTAKIVVPDSLVSSWKTATNWSTYASYIIGESDYNA